MNIHASFTGETKPVIPYARLYLCRNGERFAIVDAEDLAYWSQWRWNYNWFKNQPNTLYVRRNVGTERKTVYLHREIMIRAEPPPVDLEPDFLATHVSDHINGCTLDLRKANLRWATKSENALNTRKVRLPAELEDVMASLDAVLNLCDEIPF